MSDLDGQASLAAEVRPCGDCADCLGVRLAKVGASLAARRAWLLGLGFGVVLGLALAAGWALAHRPAAQEEDEPPPARPLVLRPVTILADGSR